VKYGNITAKLSTHAIFSSKRFKDDRKIRKKNMI
jgi:hypothetical protein